VVIVKNKIKKKKTCVIGIGCITLDGKLIRCSLEILEIMLLIVLCHFLKEENLAISVLKNKIKINNRLAEVPTTRLLMLQVQISRHFNGIGGRWLKLGIFFFSVVQKASPTNKPHQSFLLYVITYLKLYLRPIMTTTTGLMS